jgi:23S rRNA (uracil1939-C5)-methyltransferase
MRSATSKRHFPPTQYKVTIEKLAIGGAGIARHDGLVIFIPDSAPGDELFVELTFKKKNYAEAKILQILAPGPERRIEPCPIADRCGGCNWQHITEIEQRRQKHLMVQETLQKFLRPTSANLDWDFLPLQESPRSFRYRNRIQPKYAAGKLGFFSRRSHEIIEAKDCPITEELVTQQFPLVKAEMDRRFAQTREVQRLELYLDQQQNPKWLLMGEEKEGVGFSQVNRFQNDDLIRTVLEWSDGTYERVLDLYAGSGNFTFPLANRFLGLPVLAAELDPKLVQKAQVVVDGDSTLQGRVQFSLSDVGAFLKSTPPKAQDFILLDPPRAGADAEIMRSLALSNAGKIIYISCHPVSLARDLQYFFAAQAELEKQDSTSRKHRFKLRRVQCFEMFPQTDHVETIAELAVDTR